MKMNATYVVVLVASVLLGLLIAMLFPWPVTPCYPVVVTKGVHVGRRGNVVVTSFWRLRLSVNVLANQTEQEKMVQDALAREAGWTEKEARENFATAHTWIAVWRWQVAFGGKK